MSTVEDVTRDEIEQHHAHAVGVITPTIPGRDALLRDAMQCVLNQTIECQHHVILDAPASPLGPAYLRNFALSQVSCEYVAFLDDDDLIDNDHIETLLTELHAHDADLAFSWYRSEGTTPETPRVTEWDDWAYGTMLGGRNLIPVTVVAKRESILAAGGFGDERYEDHALWLRMLANGARFVVVPRETWTYRMLGENRTWA